MTARGSSTGSPPFGHNRALRQIVTQLLADRCMRALYHRGHKLGSRVLTFRGNRVTKKGEGGRSAVARATDDPIDAPAPPGTSTTPPTGLALSCPACGIVSC